MTTPTLAATVAADRSQGLGASEVGAALGLSRFVSPYALWARKTGRAEDPEQSAAMEWGLRLQPVILDAYTARMLSLGLPPFQVRANNVTRVYRGWERLFATPDGFLHDGTPRRRARIIEAKAPRSADGWGPDGSTEVPPDYYAQVQVQMLVHDLANADLAVLFHGSDFRVYPIPANPEDQAAITAAAQAWWEQYVEGDVPPPITTPSDSTEAAIRAQFQGGQGDLLPTPELDVLAHTLVMAWHNRKATNDAYDGLRQQMEALMGDHDRLAARAGVVTWARSKDSTEVAWNLVANAYRRIIEQAWQDSTGDLGGMPDLDAVESLHTYTKPGSRRFLVKPTDSTED
jgi:putative phage-type endonuclease